MKNLKLLSLLTLMIVGSSMASQEDSVIKEAIIEMPNAKMRESKKPFFPQEVLNSPDFQAFLEIYDHGTKEEKLDFINRRLLVSAQEQVSKRCPSLLSRPIVEASKNEDGTRNFEHQRLTAQEKSLCAKAEFNFVALGLLRTLVNNDSKIHPSKYTLVQ